MGARQSRRNDDVSVEDIWDAFDKSLGSAPVYSPRLMRLTEELEEEFEQLSDAQMRFIARFYANSMRDVYEKMIFDDLKSLKKDVDDEELGLDRDWETSRIEFA